MVEQFGGKYRVLAHLGQGGTANVYLAVARGPSGFNKLVVLKSMKPTLKTEPEIAAMFLSEARLAARLNHPNIVQTNEVFESSEGPVIVMEYLEGQPLSQILYRARDSSVFPERMHLRVLCEALAGLNHAHELMDFDGRALNVVHRDMSPHNIFVTFDGQVKVLDFGIAKLEGSHGETGTGVIKGKLRYMSPEQITGEGVDRRADIYAVGIMLWEAVTGERMWRGLSDATVLNRILNDEITPVREIRPDVPEALAEIVHKALRSNKEERHSSAAELLQELEDYLAKESGSAVRPRDLGAVVGRLFERERTEMRRVIEGQLSKVASLSNAEYQATEVLELTQYGTHTGLSASAADRSYPQPVSATSRAKGPLLGAAATLLLIGLFIAWQRPGSQPTTIQPQPTTAASAATTVEPAVPEQVHVRITAFPVAAQVLIDGRPQPTNPLSQEFQRDPEREIAVEARAPGHIAERRMVSLGEDAELVIILKAEPQPEEPSTPTPRTRYRPTPAPTPTPTPTTTKKSAACDPPFLIDPNGVKRFKPECL